MAVGPLEGQFYAEFVRLLGIADAFPDRGISPAGTNCAPPSPRFLTRTRAEWTEVFDGTDACVAPVLTLTEAPHHPHLAARSTFVEHGGQTQPAPAPASRPPPAPSGADPRDRAPTRTTSRRLGPPRAPAHTRLGDPVQRQIFTEEHDAFRETVRAFLAKEVLPHYEQWEQDGIVSRDAWLAAGRAGLLGLAVRRSTGAAAATTSATARPGRGVHPGRGRRTRRRPAQRHHRPLPHRPRHRRAEAPLAPGFCSGETITAIAMTEPGAGSDLQGIRTPPRTRATTGCSTAPRPSSPTASSPTW